MTKKLPITQVSITFGFGKRTVSKLGNVPDVYKKGAGADLFEAIQDLFNRPYNYITQDQMNEIRREVLKTKEKMFKRKE